ncbi:IMP cyclohydrolase [Kitasatospora viridis]|uniref:IMP cyclohydrolase n=1 Tax=Kitasatospora viridis TaxID=281105 RepID=A0A561T6U4_9ACTN|nr:IMP cyclohydrolase [Kitasatospora viridis]TWF82820.1 IMP cyclohydrolase [Kitasatospora viridis]
MDELGAVLAANQYPGRGVLWGRTGDGAVVGAYFLTGRSPASKARELRRVDGELVVAATGTGEHDHLRHYTAVRHGGELLVYGNGEQVATVAGRLDQGAAPAAALDGLDYEPDPPIFTPRLTVVADGRGTGRAWFGAARRSAGGRSVTDRLQLQVSAPDPGEAVLMTTYQYDGTELRTGAPFVEVRLEAADQQQLLSAIWDALPAQLRVAATVFAPDRVDEALIAIPTTG